MDAQPLPYHPSVPAENVFAGKELKLAERVATVLENHLITNVRTAQTIELSENDIILVSGPCSGEDILGKVLAATVSDNPAKLATRDDRWTLPWIESTYAKAAPQDLTTMHFSAKHRILRTQMAMTMLNPRQRKGPKYVVLLRHPLDMRACFYKYLRKCAKLSSEVPPGFDFDEVFPSVDSFTNVPVTLCQLGTADAASYEQFVSDWFRESRSNPDVIIVYYEALIYDPRREIQRIAAFLKGSGTVTPAWLKKANDPAFNPAPFNLGEETIVNILNAAGFIDKGKPSGGAGNRKRSTVFRRISIAVSRKARSMSRRSGSGSGSNAGFSHDGDGEEGMGGSAYENGVSVRTVQRFWESNVGLHPATYEKMYEQDMKESYPFPQVNIPKGSKNDSASTPIMDSLNKAMNVAKNRLTAVLSKSSDSFGGIRPPTSIMKMPRKQGQLPPPQNAPEVTREHADSLLPSQAFSTGEWTTTSSMNQQFGAMNEEQDDIQEELDQNEIEQIEEAEAIRHKQSGLGNGDSSQSHFQNRAQKFVSQEVMEMNILRTSMRMAGVDQKIVDVVAVKPENLSEML